MNCQDAEKLMILLSAGEEPPSRENALAAHLHDCPACREFQHTLLETQDLFQPLEEPSATAMQNVLREARLNVPQKKTFALFIWKPALALAASVLIGLGLFSLAFKPDKVGMELMVTETQLMEPADQIVSVMYEGLSEDDLAFNFLMTYEDSYASL